MRFNLRVINYTEKDIQVTDENGIVIAIYPSVLSLKTKNNEEIITLPEEEENTYYIVTGDVLMSFPERKDLLVPNGIFKNGKGKVLGSCTIKPKEE